MKTLKIALALSMVATLAGCASTTEESTEEVITIGISPDYPPYENKTPEGELVGFDIDMVEWFQDYLNENEEGTTYSLEFKEMSFDNIITQIQGDQIQVGISGFTYSEDREVEWSDPYIQTAQVAVVPEGSDITSTDQLAGKVLAAQTGATGEIAANEVEGATVQSIQNVQDIFTGLAANQFDAAIVDLGVAKEYVSNGNFTMIEGTLLEEQNYIIAKQGDTEMIDLMNKCIKAFLESDDYTALCEEYDLLPLE